ncbi:MAG: hypothetical protein ACXWB9_04120 [Flavisolibacter sp.]
MKFRPDEMHAATKDQLHYMMSVILIPPRTVISLMNYFAGEGSGTIADAKITLY